MASREPIIMSRSSLCITEAPFYARCFPFYLQSSEKLWVILQVRKLKLRVSDFPKATQQKGDITKILVLLPSLALSSMVIPLHTYEAFEHSSLTRPLYFLKRFKRKKQKQKQNPVVKLKSRENALCDPWDDFCTFTALFSLTSDFFGCHYVLPWIHLTHWREQNRK